MRRRPGWASPFIPSPRPQQPTLIATLTHDSMGYGRGEHESEGPWTSDPVLGGLGTGPREKQILEMG